MIRVRQTSAYCVDAVAGPDDTYRYTVRFAAGGEFGEAEIVGFRRRWWEDSERFRRRVESTLSEIARERARLDTGRDVL